MPIRVQHIVALQISRDTDGNQKLFYPETSEETLILDGFDGAAPMTLSVAAGATESISFGDVTAVKGLYVEVDRDCNLRVNGSSDNIPLVVPAAVTAGGARAKAFLEATITEAEIENLDGSTALTGVSVVWGDPTP